MTTHLDEADRHLEWYRAGRSPEDLTQVLARILAHLRSAESRPPIEPATAGGAPSDEWWRNMPPQDYWVSVYRGGGQAATHAANLEAVATMAIKWYLGRREAGERAERAACAKLAGHHSDEIAEVIRDRGNPPAPPPPAPAEKCPEPLPEDLCVCGQCRAAGAASQQKKVEAYERFVKRLHKSPGNNTAIAQLRRELSAGRDGGRGEEKA